MQCWGWTCSHLVDEQGTLPDLPCCKVCVHASAVLDLSQNQLTSASMVNLVPLIPAVGPGQLVGSRSSSPQQLQELHLAGNTGELAVCALQQDDVHVICGDSCLVHDIQRRQSHAYTCKSPEKQ